VEQFGLWIYRGYKRGVVKLALSVRHRHGSHDLLLSSGVHLSAVPSSRLHSLASIDRSLPIVESVATLNSLRFPLLVNFWACRSDVGVDYVRAQGGGWSVEFDDETPPEIVVFRSGGLSGCFDYIDGDYPDEERARLRVTAALQQRTPAIGVEVVPIFVRGPHGGPENIAQLRADLAKFRAGDLQ